MEQQQPQEMIEFIKPDAVMNIKINRDFYVRLTAVLNELMEKRSIDDLNSAAKQIDDKSIKDLWVYNYETMLYLIKACEDYCRANNLTEMRPLQEVRQEAEQMEQAYKESIAQQSNPQ